MATLETQDQAMTAVLQGLDQQVVNVIRAGETGERIREEIARGYVAGSSTVFQSKVENWCERYQDIMRAYQHLTDATANTQKTLTAAEDEAQQAGGNWNGDNVYSVLGGN